MFKKKEKPVLTEEQKKKKRKRRILGGVSLLLLAILILPGLFAPEALPEVTVAEAYTGSVLQTIEGSGTVKSEEIKTYFSPVSATVAEFDLKVGDMVEAGDLLLTYDQGELDQLYRQAELTGSAANYSYQDAITKNNENVSEYNRSSAALDIINRQLDEEDKNLDHLNERIREYTGYQGDSASKLASLKEQQAQVNGDLEAKQQAVAGAEAALEDYRRANPGVGETDSEYKRLSDKISEAQKNYNDAKQSAQTTLPQLAQSIQAEQNHYNEIIIKLDEYQGRLADSQENEQKLQTSKAKEEGIKESSDAAILSSAAKSQLSADNQLSSLNAQMTKDEISAGKEGVRAEFSGVVTEVSALSGGPAAKGGSLFTIASSQNVVVDMPVTRYDLEKLETGQEAEITLAGRPYKGTLTRLSRLAAGNEKGTPVVSAEVRIDDPDEYIYLGLEAKVKVQGRKAENVLVIPAEAVNTGKEGSFVYTVEEGRIVKKQVETGLASDALVEITSGLKAGEQVVKLGAELVEEGMEVRVREEGQ